MDYYIKVLPTDRSTFKTESWSDPSTGRDKAESTLAGATSQEVHSGHGVPPSGMSSKEVHHDGKTHRKKEREGLEKFGMGEGMDEARRNAEEEGGVRYSQVDWMDMKGDDAY